ncbi:hypothetical protein ACFQDZ_00770 [Sulfitobacter pacificus]|uniref:hypothetical protein n=1 Tax=Sulfitobacter pacificus TaxID=1499314 RepID=UPI0036141563
MKKWVLPSLLSKSPTAAEINPLGAFITSVEPHPDILETEIAIRDVMPTHSDGASVFKWTVRAATAQEIEDRQPFQTFEEARVAMLEWINDFLSPFTMDAGDAEPLSWIKKEAAAKAYLAGTATTDQSDMIETEAAVDGEIPADLCAAIVAQGGYTQR